MSDSGKRIVVIGASAAGLRAAARAKRLMPDSKITVLDSENIISYGACGLPYYVSGDIETPKSLRATGWGVLRDPDFFDAVKDLEVHNLTYVESVDLSSKVVFAVDNAKGEPLEVPFDKLVLATGAIPIALPNVSPDHPRIGVFKSVEDGMRWREKLEANAVDTVAIIGSGFIGIELAEAFGSMWGAQVELIEADNRVLPQLLDPEMSARVQKQLEAQDVRVHTSSCVKEIRDVEEGLEIVTDDKIIKAQYAIMAIGVRPRTDLAQQMDLQIGPRGGIVVDDKMLTSHPDVYAAGDCVEVNLVCDAKAVVPLGSLANRQGRAIGDQLAGIDTRFGKVVGSACVKVFDYNVSTCGLTQTMADRIGIENDAVWATLDDIAHYYPTNKALFCKLIYRPSDGLILGLQMLGEGQPVKRIDVLGNLMLRGGKINELLDLEFAYSPPYAPALDPLYTLGAMAMNQQAGMPCDNPGLGLAPDKQIVDVRTAGEAMTMPLDGETKNIPLEEIRDMVEMLDLSRPTQVICAKGARSFEGALVIKQAGCKDVSYVGGGYFMLKK